MIFFFLNYRKTIIIKFYFFKEENMHRDYIHKISERFERRRSIFVTKDEIRKDKPNARIASVVPTIFTEDNSKDKIISILK